MNSVINSTVMIEYAKMHSTELIRQAHLANGSSVLAAKKSSRRLSWLAAQPASFVNVFEVNIKAFWDNQLSRLWATVSTIHQTGTSNG